LVSGEGDADNGLFALSENGQLTTASVLDFEQAATRSIRVQVSDSHGGSVSRAFNIQVINDENEDLELSEQEFFTDGREGVLGVLEVLGRDDLTFQLGPDPQGAMHHYTLSELGVLVLEEDLLDSGTHQLKIIVFQGDQRMAEETLTIQVEVPEREDLLDADTSDPAYHESALMIRDLDVVQHDWRNGHNPIKSIGSIEGRDGLFVTTAQPHGRNVEDSVVLSGVRGLQIEGLKNWNFMIDEVTEKTFRIRHFGKDANGVYDGSMGQLARAIAGTSYQTSQSDFLLGPWTFGHLLGNMVGEQDDPVTFYKHFANQWKNKQTVNDWDTDIREKTQNKMVPTHVGELTLSNLPFRLLAIGNRLDLFHAKSIRDIADAGEGRFVFTMTDGFQLPANDQTIWQVNQHTEDFRDYTLIYEYGQPARDFDTLANWAKDWHKLEQVTKDFMPSVEYLVQLNDLTDRFSKRGANPAKPHGNPINQVRTNDFIHRVWQMREFNLMSKDAAHQVKASADRETKLFVDKDLQGIDVGLWTTTTKNNPMVEFSNSGNVLEELEKPLSRWINQRESQIIDGEVGPRAPQWMEGPVANEPFNFTYQVGDVRTNLARYKFSLSTCSGCHTGDTGRFFQFQMIHSLGKSEPARFVPFMIGDGGGGTHKINDRVNTKETHEFFDLKGREEIVRDILSIAEQVDAARLRLTRTEIDPLQANQAPARIFVHGGVVGDWEYSLPAGRADNNLFTLNSSTGDLSIADSGNLPLPGAGQLLLRATATDGTGVVLERPYSIWTMTTEESLLANPLDSTIQPDDPPPMVTPRPNRPH